jgi:hypothetical protein
VYFKKSFHVSNVFDFDIYHQDFGITLIIVVIWSTIVWITVTFLTKPTPEEKLMSFFTKIHPGGIGWRKISSKLPNVKADTGYAYLFLNWILGCIMVLSCLFSIGDYIFANYLKAIIETVIFASAAIGVYFGMRAYGWKNVIE